MSQTTNVQREPAKSPTTPSGAPAGKESSGGGAQSGGALREMSFAEGEAALAPDGGPAGNISGVDRTSFERWVQSSLNAVADAYGVGSGGLDVNGSLKGPTRGAVKSFQQQAKKLPGKPKLAIDGVVGKNTTGALEGATSVAAPTISEAARVKTAAAEAGKSSAAKAPVTPTGGGGGAAGGDGGTQAEAPAPTDPVKERNATDDKKPVEDATKTDAKAAEEGPPAGPRGGAAGQADELRARFPKGVLTALTIPAAYDNVDEAYNEAKEAGYAKVDGYAYKVQFPRWAPSNAGAVQGEWKKLRAQMGSKGAKLPENYGSADSKARGKIHSAMMANSAAFGVMKKAMFGDDTALHAIAKTAYGNNRYIPDSAASFAKAQGAVAVDGGALKVGKPMIYNKKGEIPTLVTGASEAVRGLLDANPPAGAAKEGQTESDAATSKVRFVSISAHGTSYWMGGHGKAGKANFTSKDVPDIVAGMASALSPDVRVRLFACHTSKASKGADDQGEGTIADVFRDELKKNGKTEGGVVGHRESGDTQRNSTTRFFGADTDKGAQDWSWKDVLTNDYLIAFLKERGLGAKGDLAKLRDPARDFFGREAWMEEIGSLEALQKSVRARWEKKYPDGASVAADVKGIKAPKI